MTRHDDWWDTHVDEISQNTSLYDVSFREEIHVEFSVPKLVATNEIGFVRRIEVNFDVKMHSLFVSRHDTLRINVSADFHDE